jgi:hypothetical protein
VTVVCACREREVVAAGELVAAFNSFLEFLSDVEVDVPLAGKHLSKMIAHCIRREALPVGMLDDPPAEFVQSGRATTFASETLALI